MMPEIITDIFIKRGYTYIVDRKAYCNPLDLEAVYRYFKLKQKKNRPKDII
jgi:hypothetical protein